MTSFLSHVFEKSYRNSVHVENKNACQTAHIQDLLQS